MTATHETLILGCEEGALPAGVPLEQALSEIAKLNAHAAHAYFVERHARGVDWNTAKASLTEKFGFTARQMSSITFPVDGKAKGILEGMKTRVEDLQGRIASAENQLKKWNTSLKNELSKDAKQRDWRVKREAAKLAGKKSPAKPKSLVKFSAHYSAELRTELRSKLFHKKRYIIHLRRVLAGLEADIAANRVRLCFGGRRLFKQQYHLAENGFTSHEEWRRAWRDERTSEFFCIGSKDEFRGSQTASWQGGGVLRLRVPVCLEKQYGKYLMLRLKAFRRDGVTAQIDSIAAAAGQRDAEGRLLPEARALAWRMVRRQTKHGPVWVAQVTYDAPAPALVSDDRLGAWGLDLNADHLAMVRIDRFGNPVERETFRFDLTDESSDQIKALMGDAAAWAVGLCIGKDHNDALPLFAEKLDFRAKRATLREKSNRYARMLNRFCYAAFNELLDRRAAAHGVELRRVNPAFTSILGDAKFGLGYAMSTHHAAACAIARRGLRYSERIARRTTGQNKAGAVLPASRNAFPLPARTRGKHVWSDWRRHGNMLRMSRLKLRAQTVVDEAGGKARKRVERSLRQRRSGWPGRGRVARDNCQADQVRRKSAKPFRWRAVVVRRRL